VAEELTPPVIPMQTGMAEVPTVHGPKALLASDDRHAGIKKDEQQYETAHKSPEGHTCQRLPEPHGPRAFQLRSTKFAKSGRAREGKQEERSGGRYPRQNVAIA
jgi:hypothetical protein